MDGDRRDEDDRPEDDDRRDESPSEALLRAARERLQARAETDDGAELAAWYESTARTVEERHDDPAFQDFNAAAATAADAAWSSATDAPAPRTPAPPQWEQDDEPFWKDENDVEDNRTVYSPGHHPTDGDGGPLVTRRRSGLRMVVAFLVLVGLAIAAVALLAAVDGSETSDAVELFAAGECLSLPDSNLITRDDVVPCDQPHQFEVTGAAVLDFDTYPADGDFGDAGVALCQPLFTSYVGATAEGPWYSYPLYPSAEAWEDGDRGISCTVVQLTDDGEWLAVTGSARGAG